MLADVSTIKTKIDSEEVLSFLRRNFSKDIGSVEEITGGALSQGFFFSSAGKEYVIRVNKGVLGYEKDKYASESFGAKGLPIPKTIALGKFNDTLDYSVTERAAGRILSDFENSQILTLMPSIVKTLDAIHSAPVEGAGYGYWNGQGKAKYSSWNEHLLSAINKNDTDINEGNCQDFFEVDVIKRLTEQYRALLDYCPEIRHLVHADYGFNNLLSNGEMVTGVIDWRNAKYGDFLYDVAWLSFWESEIDYEEIFREHYATSGVPIENYKERVLCYKLHLGLGTLFFFGKSDQKENYFWARDRLLKLIK